MSYEMDSIGLDPKTKKKFDVVKEILEHHARRKVTQSETTRFLIGIFTELDEATKLAKLEAV